MMQVEVNRALYMDEQTREKRPSGVAAIQDVLMAVLMAVQVAAAENGPRR